MTKPSLLFPIVWCCAGLSFFSASMAEEPLAEAVKRIDEKNIAQAVEKTLTLMNEFDKKQKNAQQPIVPVSPIPVPGQPAPLLKNYPTPIPSAVPLAPKLPTLPENTVKPLNDLQRNNSSSAINPGVYNTETIKNNQQPDNNFYR